MKVLVTGANGFIGTNLTNKLVSEGYEVSVLLRNPKATNDFNSQSIKVFKGDITLPSTLTEAMSGQTYVFHLAGLVAYSKTEKEKLNNINVVGTENILKQASLSGVKRVLVSSSVVAVGASFKPEILNEESQYNLDSYHLSYHESKRAMESIIRDYVRAGKIDCVIVNPSTVYGAGDAAKSTRSTQVNVAKGKSLFYPPGGVSVTSVEDVVDGMINAIKKGRSGERYILAGENVLLKDVFRMIAEEAGVKTPAIPLPSFLFKGLALLDDSLSLVGLHGPLPSERAIVATMYHWYDSSKAKRELGYMIRPAREAIAQSVQWMKSHGVLVK